MSLNSWVYNLPFNQKFILAISVALSVYILFRTFIWYANKQIRSAGLNREDSKKHMSENDKLNHLLSLGGESR